MITRFRDRRDAGRVLAQALGQYRGRPDTVVLGLPRGGVPVAFEVARALGAPLDVFVVRKLGYPGHEEYAMGAIASGGVRVLNPDLAGQVQLFAAALEQVTAREAVELERREQLVRGTRKPLDLRGRTVILVDDGLATGSTMRAAVRALRLLGPARVVVGVPVACPDTCRELAREVDEIVCATAPQPFSSVGRGYRDFEQTTDEEVQELLALSEQPGTAVQTNAPAPPTASREDRRHG